IPVLHLPASSRIPAKRFTRQSQAPKKGDGSALARRADERLHVVKVAFEGAAPGGGQAELGPRDAPLEGLGAGDVLRVLELARVDAEVAVRGFEQLLELVEGERRVDGGGASA